MNRNTSLLSRFGNVDSQYKMSFYNYNRNRINNPNNLRNPLKYEVRTVQKNANSLVLILPKLYTDILKIQQCDLIKMQLLKDEHKITLQKIDLEQGV
jgi:hypothetical protein